MSIDSDDSKTKPSYHDGDSCMRCIAAVTENLSGHYAFCTGEAIRHLWRAGGKAGESLADDKAKASWYLHWTSTHGAPCYPTVCVELARIAKMNDPAEIREALMSVWVAATRTVEAKKKSPGMPFCVRFDFAVMDGVHGEAWRVGQDAWAVALREDVAPGVKVARGAALYLATATGLDRVSFAGDDVTLTEWRIVEEEMQRVRE